MAPPANRTGAGRFRRDRPDDFLQGLCVVGNSQLDLRHDFGNRLPGVMKQLGGLCVQVEAMLQGSRPIVIAEFVVVGHLTPHPEAVPMFVELQLILQLLAHRRVAESKGPRSWVVDDYVEALAK